MTATTPAFGTFFYPGPTEVRAEILAAMVRPMISHRSGEFRELFRRMQPGLQSMFGTRRPVCISTSSATGMMESAARAVPTGLILSVVNGAFARRFAEIAESVGHRVVRLDVPWGEVADPAAVDGALEKLANAGTPASAVTVVHSETSTGALSDIAAVAAVCRRHDALCLVDSVTGIAGARFDFDGWDVDFAFTGSQKAMAIPPGLSFVAASDRLLEHASRSTTRGYYLDILDLVRYAEKSETPSTPAIPLFFALEAQLDAIQSEGIEQRIARHAGMAEMTRRWVGGWTERTGSSLRVLAPAGARSPTVSVIALPDGISGRDFAKKVGARGFTIAGGYGDLAETTFRIGHMGDHSPDNLTRCLAACDSVLEEVTSGGKAAR